MLPGNLTPELLVLAPRREISLEHAFLLDFGETRWHEMFLLTKRRGWRRRLLLGRPLSLSQQEDVEMSSILDDASHLRWYFPAALAWPRLLYLRYLLKLGLPVTDDLDGALLQLLMEVLTLRDVVVILVGGLACLLLLLCPLELSLSWNLKWRELLVPVLEELLVECDSVTENDLSE